MDKLISSIYGVSLAEILTLPICTIKTIYQVENLNIRDSVKKIYRNPSTIYKSTIPAVAAQIYSSTYKLFLFTYFQSYFHKAYEIMILSAIISVSALIVTHPLDYFRVSYQINSSIGNNYFKGIVPNIMKATIGGITYLPIRQIIKNNYPHLESWKAGLYSALISTIIVHPFDYFKTYLLGNNHSNINFMKSYRGIHINLLRIIPHFIIMTETSDYVIKNLNK